MRRFLLRRFARFQSFHASTAQPAPAPAITAVRFTDASTGMPPLVSGSNRKIQPRGEMRADVRRCVAWQGNLSNYGHIPRTLLSVGSVRRHWLISFLYACPTGLM